MVKELCFRCKRPVYPTDRIGPLKDGTLFHHGCFKCYICGTRLTLKSYCHNRNNIDDQEVYCNNHVPQANPHDPVPHRSNLMSSMEIAASSVSVLRQNGGSSDKTENGADQEKKPIIQDMHIQHALKATEIRKPYPKMVHPGANYVVDYDQQTRLELIHRKEEDDLYRVFSKQREEEEQRFTMETKEEWERALLDFSKRYEQQKQKFNEKGHNRDDFIRQLTLKRDKKQQTMRMVMQERERSMTADLVEKQSREMMDLFKQARQHNGDVDHNQSTSQHLRQNSKVKDSLSQSSPTKVSPYPLSPPPPSPPKFRTQEFTSEYFSKIDEIAISVAQSEVHTFTDLIRALTYNTKSDVEVARAIYRWITVKNLNTMEFDHRIDPDTPMGLLRGIKYGTESYHVLFKRLCSYAGLHCVVIKGFSKSAGYQPGIRFDDNRFRNTWNAVYLEGCWRFVQCNWGARHLVNRQNDASLQSTQPENLRYEYDDHYFYTPPEQFIFEFFPNRSEWQLLKNEISLQQFENLPFVRSLFFRYNLNFSPPNLPAVLVADEAGTTNISLQAPNKLNTDQCLLLFHYNLKFFDSTINIYDGCDLKRFVMQSTSRSDASKFDLVHFRIHLPGSGDFLLDIFAHETSRNEYLRGKPLKFKSVCKWKIVAPQTNSIMVPLPECAGGEWGPEKARRLFFMRPLTHQEPIVNHSLMTSSPMLKIAFKLEKPCCEFVTSLRKNGRDERKLSKIIENTFRDNILTLNLNFSGQEQGQYGLDVYCRENLDNNLLTHCCKYLINMRN